MQLFLVIFIIGAALGEGSVKGDTSELQPSILDNPRDDVIHVEPRDTVFHELHFEFKPRTFWRPIVLTHLYTQFVFKSSNFPYSYNSNEDIAYRFISPFGSQILLNCTVFDVYKSENCQIDKFEASLSGDTEDGSFYTSCGHENETLLSFSNSLSVRFTSGDIYRPENNRFSCEITAVPQTPIDEDPPTTTTVAPPTTQTTSKFTSTRPRKTSRKPASTKPRKTTRFSSTTTAAPATTPPASQTCTCGARNRPARIVNGSDAGVNEFPWRCSLQPEHYLSMCGATLISPNFVLTAAHCFDKMNFQDRPFTIKCGNHYAWGKYEDSSVTIRVDKYIPHPSYSKWSPNKEHDISLLHLSSPMPYSSVISPACLPFNSCGDLCKRDNAQVVASGWGVDSHKGKQMQILQKVDLPCMSGKTCNDKFYRGHPREITDNMICTYKEGKDACQGDSGGSIDFAGPNGYCAVGVVSWGEGCAWPNKPGVFTNVANYLPWIQETTGERFCGDGK